MAFLTRVSVAHMAMTSQIVERKEILYIRMRSQKETISVRSVDAKSIPPAILDSVCKNTNAIAMSTPPMDWVDYDVIARGGSAIKFC